ncbi:MAG TPA: hypothetical protein VGN37_26895 [Actinocatenispora sp.]
MCTTGPGFVGRLARFVRLIGVGRNPLRRRSDRVEGLVLVAAILMCLAAVPAGVAVGVGATGDGYRTASRLATAGHPAAAVLLADVPTPPDGALATDQPVPARWRTAGQNRSGTITAPPGLRRGGTVTIRLDAAGRPVPAPEPRHRIVVDGVGAGLAVLFGSTAVALLLTVTTRWLLNRRRLAAWAAEWSAGRHDERSR